MSVHVACLICGAGTRESFRATVLKHHEASYRQCSDCGFLYAARPDWLKEAYSSAIARADTGLVQRNLAIADKLTAILSAFLDQRGRFLDMAGGTGLLVRLMRDRGFDYFWDDGYCANVHAPGFEASAGQSDYEAVTAFEALEHMEDPMAFVADALARTKTRTLIFTTELHDGVAPPADWWYYTFPTGQHIAFFSEQTLSRMGQRLGCTLVSSRGMHTLSARAFSQRKYSLVLRSLRRYYGWRVHRSLASRTDSDHRELLARVDNHADE